MTSLLGICYLADLETSHWPRNKLLAMERDSVHKGRNKSLNHCRFLPDFMKVFSFKTYEMSFKYSDILAARNLADLALCLH